MAVSLTDLGFCTDTLLADTGAGGKDLLALSGICGVGHLEGTFYGYLESSFEH